MAEVYVAHYEGEGGFSKRVALKMGREDIEGAGALARGLIEEAKVMVTLQHPNMVQVYDVGQVSRRYFLTMEYVDGPDLGTVMRELERDHEKMPVSLAGYIVMEVLKGLTFIHGRCDGRGRPLEYVHRDISPQNILLSFSGEVKIGDFGIARGRHREQETQFGMIKGKYAYMSPEQARGEPVDHRSDIYSAGVLFFELLSGMRYASGSDVAVVDAVRSGKRPIGWERTMGRLWRVLVRRATHLDREERYENADRFFRDLYAALVEENALVHSADLAHYLEKRFGYLKRTILTPDAVGNATQREWPVGRALAVSRWRLRIAKSLLVVAVVMMSGMVGGHSRERRSIPLSQRVESAPVAVAPPTSPSPPVGVDSPTSLLPPTPPPSKHVSATGTLTIVARPWGVVSIDGVLNRREVPVTRELAPGDYHVLIEYGTKRKRVERHVTIETGQSTICAAVFNNGRASMSCRVK